MRVSHELTPFSELLIGVIVKYMLSVQAFILFLIMPD